jgi:hypothetical protein
MPAEAMKRTEAMKRAQTAKAASGYSPGTVDLLRLGLRSRPGAGSICLKQRAFRLTLKGAAFHPRLGVATAQHVQSPAQASMTVPVGPAWPEVSVPAQRMPQAAPRLTMAAKGRATR